MSRVWRGWVRVTPRVYGELVTLAGAAADDPSGCWATSFALPLARAALPEDAPMAVYVAENRAGRACYVGKFERCGAGRARDGVRLAEHLREESKAQEWARVWVVPLREDTSHGAVLGLEAAVAARLGLPVVNRTWRRPARRS